MTPAFTAGGSSCSQRKKSFRFPLNATSIRWGMLLRELSHPEKLVAPAAHELVRLVATKVFQLFDERLSYRGGGRFVVRVRAAGRLGNDLVDHAQLEQLGRRDLE